MNLLKKINKNIKGYSLPEVMIAIGLASVTSLAVMGLAKFIFFSTRNVADTYTSGRIVTQIYSELKLESPNMASVIEAKDEYLDPESSNYLGAERCYGTLGEKIVGVINENEPTKFDELELECPFMVWFYKSNIETTGKLPVFKIHAKVRYFVGKKTEPNSKRFLTFSILTTDTMSY